MKFKELGLEWFSNPPYSPLIHPCDYFLFPKLKKRFGERIFGSKVEVVALTIAYFEDHYKSYNLKRTKCIELKRD